MFYSQPQPFYTTLISNVNSKILLKNKTNINQNQYLECLLERKTSRECGFNEVAVMIDEEVK